jgi:hypothetical protein
VNEGQLQGARTTRTQPKFARRKDAFATHSRQLLHDLSSRADSVINPVVMSCRALMARVITGPFETRKPGNDVPPIDRLSTRS